MEHTKLPKLALGFMNQGLGHGHYAVLCEESGELFAKVPFGDKNLAAQVVRACNAFPAMEKALRDVQIELRHLRARAINDERLDAVHEIDKRISQVKAALATGGE